MSEGNFRQIHTPDQYTFDGGQGWSDQMRYGSSWKPSEMPNDMPQRMRFTIRGGHLNFTPYAPFSCAYGEANVYNEKGLAELIEETKKYGKCFVFTAARGPVKEAVKKFKQNVEILVSQETWMGKYDVWLCVTKTV